MRTSPYRVIPAAGMAALAALSWQAGSISSSFLAPDPPAQDELSDLLDVIEFVDLDDGQSGTVRTLRFSAVNLQIVNGEGGTETADGTGNLIVGYDELTATTMHTGSHNVVVGTEQEYTSFGGLVAGRGNVIEAPFAVVSGGRANKAGGDYASVGGGRQNSATGDYATVVGGRRNKAVADYTAILGGGSETIGQGNEASADYATVVGGQQNTASGIASAILGGLGNSAPGEAAVVAGGQGNLADGLAGAILGGLNESTTTDHQVIGDSGGEDGDWTVTSVGGTSALVANAERVGIGTQNPSAPLTIVPPVGESVAVDLAGDLLIGRGSDVDGADASEHIEIRTPDGSWFVGAGNDKARPNFFIGRQDAPDGIFTLTVDGDVGLGTTMPEGALHVARSDGDAHVVLEGGDVGKGEEVGIRMLQSGDVEAQVGFFDEQFVMRYADGQVGLVLDEQGGFVHVHERLEVTGPANVGENLTVVGPAAIDGHLLVAGDVTLESDFLHVGGDLEVDGAIRTNLFNLEAWGVVGKEGERVLGSSNWSSTWDVFAGTYKITLNSGSAKKALVIHRAVNSEDAPYSEVRTLGTDPQLEDNEIRVKFHDTAAPKYRFSFFVITE